MASRYDTKMVERESKKLLRQLGLLPNLLGYQYLIYAIELCIDDPSMCSSKSIHLYSLISELFYLSSKKDVTGSSVERCIRHAVGVAVANGNVYQICDLNPEIKLTNSSFIGLLTEEVADRIENSLENK